MTPPESHVPATEEEEEEPEPISTWVPTIWALLDPDSFHPPDPRGVLQVREHGIRVGECSVYNFPL